MHLKLIVQTIVTHSFDICDGHPVVYAKIDMEDPKQVYEVIMQSYEENDLTTDYNVIDKQILSIEFAD